MTGLGAIVGIGLWLSVYIGIGLWLSVYIALSVWLVYRRLNHHRKGNRGIRR